MNKDLLISRENLAPGFSDTFVEWLDLSTNIAADTPEVRRRKPKQDWQLTEDSLLRFLAWLHPDASSATQEYQKVRQKLAWFFDSNGCIASDACADITIDRVAKKLVQGEIVHHKWGYLHGVARNVLCEYRRTVAMSKEPSFGSALGPTSTSPAAGNAAFEELQEDCRKHCLWRLPRDQRALLIRYYVGEPGTKLKCVRQRLAAESGWTLNALRQRINEIRAKLARCADACLARDLPRP